MDTGHGALLSRDDKGLVKRVILPHRKADLEESSAVSLIVEYSELDFRYYARVVDLIRGSVDQLPVQGDETAVDMTVFQFILDTAEDLVASMEEETPLEGTLLRAALEDRMPEDDGSALYVYEVAMILLDTLTEVMVFQFVVNEALYDLADGVPLDFQEKYAQLRQMQIPQVLTMEADGVSGSYLLRSPVQYYHLLLLWALDARPNLAQCRCCGRFFLPRTKKRTLYCDRVLKDDKTCKYWGPVLKHRLDTLGSRVIAEYDRAKRRMYKRYERASGKTEKTTGKDLSYEEYYDWLERATEARDGFLRGKVSEGEAMEAILSSPPAK